MKLPDYVNWALLFTGIYMTFFHDPFATYIGQIPVIGSFLLNYTHTKVGLGDAHWIHAGLGILMLVAWWTRRKN